MHVYGVLWLYKYTWQKCSCVKFLVFFGQFAPQKFVTLQIFLPVCVIAVFLTREMNML